MKCSVAILLVCLTSAFAGKCRDGFRKINLRQGGDMNDFFDVKFISGAGVSGDAMSAVNSPTCSQAIDGNTCLQVKPKENCELFKACILTKNEGTVSFQWQKGTNPYEEMRQAAKCPSCDQKCIEFDEGKNNVSSFRYCFDGEGCTNDRMKIGGATSVWCCPI